MTTVTASTTSTSSGTTSSSGGTTSSGSTSNGSAGANPPLPLRRGPRGPPALERCRTAGSGLNEHWIEIRDSSTGSSYFYNRRTKQSARERPPEFSRSQSERNLDDTLARLQKERERQEALGTGSARFRRPLAVAALAASSSRSGVGSAPGTCSRLSSEDAGAHNGHAHPLSSQTQHFPSPPRPLNKQVSMRSLRSAYVKSMNESNSDTNDNTSSHNGDTKSSSGTQAMKTSSTRHPQVETSAKFPKMKTPPTASSNVLPKTPSKSARGDDSSPTTSSKSSGGDSTSKTPPANSNGDATTSATEKGDVARQAAPRRQLQLREVDSIAVIGELFQDLWVNSASTPPAKASKNDIAAKSSLNPLEPPPIQLDPPRSPASQDTDRPMSLPVRPTPKRSQEEYRRVGKTQSVMTGGNSMLSKSKSPSHANGAPRATSSPDVGRSSSSPVAPDVGRSSSSPMEIGPEADADADAELQRKIKRTSNFVGSDSEIERRFMEEAAWFLDSVQGSDPEQVRSRALALYQLYISCQVRIALEAEQAKLLVRAELNRTNTVGRRPSRSAAAAAAASPSSRTMKRLGGGKERSSASDRPQPRRNPPSIDGARSPPPSLKRPGKVMSKIKKASAAFTFDEASASSSSKAKRSKTPTRSKSPISLRRHRSPSRERKQKKKLAKSPSGRITPRFRRSNTHSSSNGGHKPSASVSNAVLPRPMHPRYAKRSASCAPTTFSTRGASSTPPKRPTSPATMYSANKFSLKAAAQQGRNGSPRNAAAAQMSPGRYTRTSSHGQATNTSSTASVPPKTMPNSATSTPPPKKMSTDYYRSVSVRQRRSPAPVSIGVVVDPSRFSNTTTRLDTGGGAGGGDGDDAAVASGSPKSEQQEGDAEEAKLVRQGSAPIADSPQRSPRFDGDDVDRPKARNHKGESLVSFGDCIFDPLFEEKATKHEATAAATRSHHKASKSHGNVSVSVGVGGLREPVRGHAKQNSDPTGAAAGAGAVAAAERTSSRVRSPRSGSGGGGHRALSPVRSRSPRNSSGADAKKRTDASMSALWQEAMVPSPRAKLTGKSASESKINTSNDSVTPPEPDMRSSARKAEQAATDSPAAPSSEAKHASKSSDSMSVPLFSSHSATNSAIGAVPLSLAEALGDARVSQALEEKNAVKCAPESKDDDADKVWIRKALIERGFPKQAVARAVEKHPSSYKACLFVLCPALEKDISSTDPGVIRARLEQLRYSEFQVEFALKPVAVEARESPRTLRDCLHSLEPALIHIFFPWGQRAEINAEIMAKHEEFGWHPAGVLRLNDERPHDEEVLIHYSDFHEAWNEWVPLRSARLAEKARVHVDLLTDKIKTRLQKKRKSDMNGFKTLLRSLAPVVAKNAAESPKSLKRKTEDEQFTKVSAGAIPPDPLPPRRESRISSNGRLISPRSRDSKTAASPRSPSFSAATNSPKSAAAYSTSATSNSPKSPAYSRARHQFAKHTISPRHTPKAIHESMYREESVSSSSSSGIRRDKSGATTHIRYPSGTKSVYSTLEESRCSSVNSVDSDDESTSSAEDGHSGLSFLDFVDMMLEEHHEAKKPSVCPTWRFHRVPPPAVAARDIFAGPEYDKSSDDTSPEKGKKGELQFWDFIDHILADEAQHQKESEQMEKARCRSQSARTYHSDDDDDLSDTESVMSLTCTTDASGGSSDSSSYAASSASDMHSTTKSSSSRLREWFSTRGSNAPKPRERNASAPSPSSMFSGHSSGVARPFVSYQRPYAMMSGQQQEPEAADQKPPPRRLSGLFRGPLLSKTADGGGGLGRTPVGSPSLDGGSRLLMPSFSRATGSSWLGRARGNSRAANVFAGLTSLISDARAASPAADSESSKSDTSSSSYSDTLGSLTQADLTKSMVNQLEAHIAHPRGLAAFRKHLDKEASTENLLFCIAARDFYNEAPDLEPDEVDARAQEIFDTYIAVGSSFQVNLSHPEVQEIKLKIESPDILDIGVFEHARTAIFSLMAHDSFRRYIRQRVRRKRTASRMHLQKVFSDFEVEQKRLAKAGGIRTPEGNVLPPVYV